MSSPDVMSSPRGLPDRRSRKRDSRPTHRTVSSPYFRDVPTAAAAPMTTLFSNFSWPSSADNYATLHSPGQTPAADFLNSFDLLSPTQPGSNPGSLGLSDDSWVKVAPPHSPSSVWSGSAFLEHTLNQFIAQSVSGPQSPVSSKVSVSSPSWEILSTGRGRDSDLRNLVTEETAIPHGSLENEGMATPNTFNSSFSEEVPLVGSSSGFESSMRAGSDVLHDMRLPGDFFDQRYMDLFGISYENQALPFPTNLSFDTNTNTNPPQSRPDWNSQHTFGENNLPSGDFRSPQSVTYQYPRENALTSEYPWNSQNAQISGFGVHSTAGDVTFEPALRPTYDILYDRETLFDHQSQDVAPIFGPASSTLPNEAMTDPSRSDSEIGSPILQHTYADHSHVFAANPETEVPDSQRGRKRRLTEEEREHTLKVRTLGACWACHLSKTRCSPCGPGSPCEQCTRLVNKRRFYHLSCFNDPIESLNGFLIPDYLVGHITSSNVENFVTDNVSAWGTHNIAVRLQWGCGQPFEVTVENLFFRDGSFGIAHVEQAIVDQDGRAQLVRLRCPPLGIPLASATRDLKQDFREYIRKLVKTDLSDYSATAYDEPDSEVPQRLLEAVCEWYIAGVERGAECQILRLALEIHITCTMLERSFLLDEESANRVQTVLNQEFPRGSAPKCAQRQMKLALFCLQRPRIVDVLQRWSKMMHSSASTPNKWEISFCVFVLLTLVMDKTIAAAHTLCEMRIQLQGLAEQAQKGLFHELVTLMQREFFERCKEIFHSRFKTRRNGKESCNPIRDGMGAWRGKEQPEFRTIQLVGDVQRVMRDFGIGRETRPSAQSPKHGQLGGVGEEYEVSDNVYANLGRLATIFLRDFK